MKKNCFYDNYKERAFSNSASGAQHQIALYSLSSRGVALIDEALKISAASSCFQAAHHIVVDGAFHPLIIIEAGKYYSSSFCWIFIFPHNIGALSPEWTLEQSSAPLPHLFASNPFTYPCPLISPSLIFPSTMYTMGRLKRGPNLKHHLSMQTPNIGFCIMLSRPWECKV